MIYAFQFSDVLQYWPELAWGAVNTLVLSGLAMAIGLVVAILGALGKTSGSRWLRWTIDVYIEIIRNTPFLVQVLLIFFGLPSLGLRFSPNTAALIAFPGFWRTLSANLTTGFAEMANSALRRRYLRACQRYCPSLRLEDLQPHAPGIRAQAVMRDGTLVHDFLIRQTARTIHVCNAPSPAATSAIPIAGHIAGLAAESFALRGSVQVL